MFQPQLLNSSSLLLRAVSHPLRYKMLKIISDKGVIGADQLAKHAGLSPSLCSQQLRILKAAGLLTIHRNHKHLSYSIVNQRVEKIKQFVDLFFAESHEA